MGKEKNNKDEFRILATAYKKLVRLSDQAKKIHDAQMHEIDVIQSVVGRICDDRGVKQKAERDKKIFELLQANKDLISSLRSLLRQ